MEMVLTAKLKLHATPEQFRALRQTQLAYRDALNYVSRYAFAHGKLSNKVGLQVGTYQELRARFGLPAQMACSVPRQVGAAYQTLWTRVKANAAARAAGLTKKRYRGIDAAPRFISPTLTYQLGHDYSFKTGKQVSLLSLSTYSKVWHASGGLAWPGARADDPSVVDRRAARGVGGGEPASHRAGGVAGAHGLAGGPGLLRPADRHDPCLRDGRGADLAAPLRAAGGRRFGGPSAQRAPVQGPTGWSHRRCAGQSVSALLGPCAGLLECGAAGHLPGAALPPAALPFQCAALSAPHGLALGTSPPGARPQTRSRGGRQGRGPGPGRSGGCPGAGPPVVSGRKRTPPAAAGARQVDERPARAHPHTRHQRPPRLFWRLACGPWALAVGRPRPQAGQPFRRLSGALGRGLPHWPALSGPRRRPRPHGQGGPALARRPSARHCPPAAHLRRPPGQPS